MKVQEAKELVLRLIEQDVRQYHVSVPLRHWGG